MGICEPDFSIDAGLMRALQQDSEAWLTPEWFTDIVTSIRILWLSEEEEDQQEEEKMEVDRLVFSALFDRIDPKDQGDVDEKEWRAGLQRLAVDMAGEDMTKLFKLSDGDRSGYMD